MVNQPVQTCLAPHLIQLYKRLAWVRALGTGMQAWASECVLEMAVPPVAASAYWTLQSAAAMVATQLGTTLRYIMQQHSMWHMAQVGTIEVPNAGANAL